MEYKMIEVTDAEMNAFIPFVSRYLSDHHDKVDPNDIVSWLRNDIEARPWDSEIVGKCLTSMGWTFYRAPYSRDGYWWRPRRLPS